MYDQFSAGSRWSILIRGVVMTSSWPFRASRRISFTPLGIRTSGRVTWEAGPDSAANLVQQGRGSITGLPRSAPASRAQHTP